MHYVHVAGRDERSPRGAHLKSEISMADEWEKLSGKELDHSVSCSKWSNRLDLFPDIVEHFVSTCAKETKSTQKCVSHELDVRYGEGKSQTLDLYLPDHQTEDSPVLICIHGGYWQASSKDDFGLVALHPAKQGAVVAVVSYTLAPTGTLPQMIKDIEQAILYMAKKFPKARGFYIIGHSAGGHLGAMMLSVEWSEKHGLPKDFIKGACLVSGVFDVRPLVGSYINEPLHLTQDEAFQFSPINPTYLSETIRLCRHCKIINICGEHETPLLHRLMRDYTTELTKGSVDATCEVIPGLDHFELIERLSDAEYSLTKILLAMMSLSESGAAT